VKADGGEPGEAVPGPARPPLIPLRAAQAAEAHWASAPPFCRGRPRRAGQARRPAGRGRNLSAALGPGGVSRAHTLMSSRARTAGERARRARWDGVSRTAPRARAGAPLAAGASSRSEDRRECPRRASALPSPRSGRQRNVPTARARAETLDRAGRRVLCCGGEGFLRWADNRMPHRAGAGAHRGGRGHECPLCVRTRALDWVG
jgi:hypothetical protein